MATDNGDIMKRSADISDCGRYRWWLRRDWGGPLLPQKIVTWIMLNPSKADGEQDDPTIRRCIGFSRQWGYTALSVRNLFPWRATDPRELFTAESVTGGRRGDAEILAARSADLIVVAWGANVPFGRDRQVLDMLAGVPLFCLGKTKGGHPRHPVRLSSQTALEPFGGVRA